MHSLWTNRDVLYAILRILDRSDHVRLARVGARELSDVSLDMLWHTQTGIGPLVRTMAPDLWQRDGSGKLRLLRAIRPSDWTGRFQIYAARIKKIVDSNTTVFDHRSAFVLVATAPSLPFLTNLYDLRINAEMLAMAPLFVKSDLTRLTLWFVDESPSLCGAFVKNVPTLFPKLERLDVVLHNESRVETAFSTEVVNSPLLNTLTRLVCSSALSAGAFIDFTALPNLRKIEFIWPNDSADSLAAALRSHTPSPPAAAPSWPSLSHISVELWPTIDSMIPILDVMDCQLLEIIEVAPLRDDYPGTPEQFTSFFEIVNRKCNPYILDKIHIEICEAGEPSLHTIPDGTILSIRSLQPILSFHRLRHFVCRVVYGYDMDDDDIVTLAKSWPSLEILELLSDYGWGCRPRITIVGLAELIGLCPQLFGLSIVIDATNGVVYTPSSSDVSQNHRIQFLNVNNSLIRNPLAAASSLAAVAPNLRNVRAWDASVQSRYTIRLDPHQISRSGVPAYLVDRYVGRWKEVEKILRRAGSPN